MFMFGNTVISKLNKWRKHAFYQGLSSQPIYTSYIVLNWKSQRQVSCTPKILTTRLQFRIFQPGIALVYNWSSLNWTWENLNFSVHFCSVGNKIWAVTWQNQQNECAPSEDLDQPGHPPSLIRVFAVRMKKAWVLTYPLSAQRSLWSDWADAQADPSLRWALSHFVGFVMSMLKFVYFP